MNIIFSFLILMVLILYSGNSVYATSYHIYPGDDLANTITNNTCSWDIVYVHEGIHTLKSDVNISGKSLPIVGDGSEKTIIILDDHIFRFYKTENNANPMTLTISGITFRNASNGESIYFENYIPQSMMQVSMSDCNFENIGDVAFISADYPIRDYKRTINRCDIYYGQSAPVEITPDLINKVKSYESFRVRIIDSNFTNSNDLTIYSFSPESNIDFKIENSRLINNNTGLQTFGPVTISVKNNLIIGNFKGVLLNSPDSTGFLNNNTINSNGDTQGFGIYNRGKLYLENNIISNNNYGIYNEGEIIQSNNLLWSNISNNLRTSSDFLSFDPKFTSGPRGDYYLSGDSQCIDAGSNTVSYLKLNDRTTSVDERLDWGVVDLGYHYPSKYKISFLDRLIGIFR